MGGRFVEADGTKLWIRFWGDPAGVAVLCWHMLGAGQTGERFAGLARQLVERHGFHVLAVDGPGFGRSPTLRPDAYRPSMLADLAARMLAALSIESVHFVGASWGGTVGCYVAERHRERLRRLVLLDVGYQQPLEPGPLEAWLARASERDDGVPADVRGPILWGVASEPPSAEQLSRARVPVLLMTAMEPNEDATAIDRFKSVLPTADVHRVAGAAHDVLGDAEDEVSEIIGAWLSRPS